MTRFPGKTPPLSRYKFRMYVVLLLISIWIALMGIFAALVIIFSDPCPCTKDSLAKCPAYTGSQSTFAEYYLVYGYQS